MKNKPMSLKRVTRTRDIFIIIFTIIWPAGRLGRDGREVSRRRNNTGFFFPFPFFLLLFYFLSLFHLLPGVRSLSITDGGTRGGHIGRRGGGGRRMAARYARLGRPQTPSATPSAHPGHVAPPRKRHSAAANWPPRPKASKWQEFESLSVYNGR